MGCAVVGERAARGGHDHLVGGLGDGQLADGLGFKPVVRPLRRPAPLDLVGVVALADPGLAADHLKRDGLAVDQAVDLAVSGQGLAVVNLVGAFGGHRQRRRGDLVRHVDAAGVVALAGHSHRDGTRVGRVPRVCQLVVDALDQHLIAVLHDRLLLLGLAAVHDVGRSPDGHIGRGDLLGRDAQHALVLGDGVVVRVEALALGIDDRVRHLAVGNVGSAARGAHGGDLAVDEALIAELLPADNLGPGERGAVEHLRGAFALQFDRALGDGQLLRAVHVALVVARAGRAKLNRRGIGHVGRRERAGVGHPVLAVKAVLDGHRILRRDRRGRGLRRKRLAVVDLEGGDAAQRDLPLRLSRGHLQRADGIGAVGVVALLRGLVERDRVCVRAGTRIGLAAGHGKRRLLAVDQADDLSGRRQRSAVVDLEGPFGHDMVLGRRDLDDAGLLLDIKLVGDVLALSVDDDQLVDRSGHARLIGRIGCRGVGVRGLHRIALGQAGHGHVDAVGLAVVDAGIAAGRRDHAAGELGDGQLADGFGDRVVRLFGGGACRRPVDGVGVVARAHLGLAAGGLEGRGLAVDEAGDGAGGGQGVAVVDPGGARRGHRQRRGRDAVRALDAAGVVALAGDGHRDDARHVGEVIGAVGHRVVGALHQDLLPVLHLGSPLVLLAVVDQVARAGNHHVGGGGDILRDDRQLALSLLDGEVACLEAVLPGVGDGVGNLALGHRHDLADRLQVIDLATEQGIGALDRHRVIGLVRAVVHELARVGRKLHGSGRDLVLP